MQLLQAFYLVTFSDINLFNLPGSYMTGLSISAAVTGRVTATATGAGNATGTGTGTGDLTPVLIRRVPSARNVRQYFRLCQNMVRWAHYLKIQLINILYKGHFCPVACW